ncbi:MAG: response regulator [Azoarcus sp.]|nr:response regulator [Azoarcus sp.]
MIDDSPTILTAMKRFLESTECVFLGALDAKTGLEMALTQKPELIFLDIVMPSINGFAALRALRKSPRTRDVPIIMMSGNEQAKAQFFGAHIGADDFMKKPFSRFEVFARIARLLDKEGIPRRPPLPGSAPREMSLDDAVEENPSPPAPPSQPVVAVAAAEKTGRPALAPPPPIPAAASPHSQPAAASAPSQPVAVQHAPPLQSQPSQAVSAPAKLFATVALPSAPPLLQAEEEPVAPPPPVQSVVSPELLTQIARLAQLAQSDPEALAALSVLSAQLSAQLATAAMRPTPQPRAVSM